MTSRERRIVVSLSGGKDSTACILLAMEEAASDLLAFVFADTGNEHEMTYRYVREYLPARLGIRIEEVKADFTTDIARKRRYIVEKWPGKGVPQPFCERALGVLHPTGVPFLDLCMMKGRFPSRMAQFCTQELKRYPLDAHLLGLVANGYAVESWRGVRRDESRNRRDTLDREMTPEGFEIVMPIASWTAEQVVSFVLSRDVELNPLYKLGMGRVGCMPCINCSKGELAEIANRFPEHIDKIREWEQLVSEASKRGYTSFFTDSNPEGSEQYLADPASQFARLRIDERVRWAKTTRGGVQGDLLKTADVAPSCSSLYGLCE